MQDQLRVGELSVPAGSRLAQLHPITLGGQEVSVPVFLVNGGREGPTLAVTAGIHGAEYSSIEAALRLGRSLRPEELRGEVIVVPVVNSLAFRNRSIYVCPIDGKNVNRVFPGSPDGTASEMLAHWLLQNVILQADYYVDLHGGDLIEELRPYTNYYRTGSPAVSEEGLRMAKVFGIPYVKGSDSMGSACASAAQAGIPSILAESGGQGIWTEGSVGLLTNGLDRLMHYLDMLDGDKPEPVPVRELTEAITLRSEHDGYYYPCVRVGELIQKGQHVADVADFVGNVVQAVVSPIDGSVLYVVSSLAINHADPLMSIGR